MDQNSGGLQQVIKTDSELVYHIICFHENHIIILKLRKSLTPSRPFLLFFAGCRVPRLITISYMYIT